MSLFHSEKKKFTGHERDNVGQDYMHARYYTGYWGRFLSVDPIMSADPQFPQSWNRYAYALNNPLKFTDPTGMYVFGACAGDEKRCKADQDAFEKARQDQLKSSDESVRNAAAAYGELGDKNGVTVAFATGKDLGAFNGESTAQLVRGEQVSARYDVRIQSGLRGSDLGNATVHEGEHVRKCSNIRQRAATWGLRSKSESQAVPDGDECLHGVLGVRTHKQPDVELQRNDVEGSDATRTAAAGNRSLSSKRPLQVDP